MKRGHAFISRQAKRSISSSVRRGLHGDQSLLENGGPRGRTRRPRLAGNQRRAVALYGRILPQMFCHPPPQRSPRNLLLHHVSDQLIGVRPGLKTGAKRPASIRFTFKKLSTYPRSFTATFRSSSTSLARVFGSPGRDQRTRVDTGDLRLRAYVVAVGEGNDLLQRLIRPRRERVRAKESVELLRHYQGSLRYPTTKNQPERWVRAVRGTSLRGAKRRSNLLVCLEHGRRNCFAPARFATRSVAGWSLA